MVVSKNFLPAGQWCGLRVWDVCCGLHRLRVQAQRSVSLRCLLPKNATQLLQILKSTFYRAISAETCRYESALAQCNACLGAKIFTHYQVASVFYSGDCQLSFRSRNFYNGFDDFWTIHILLKTVQLIGRFSTPNNSLR